ncbi:MAG: DUF1579 domain-containing protein [Melioribacteraceae bacterium]|nr:DUF1579 domain-containing protein [Melioribacteraceae bacterium]WKZ68147.1 MAG: DUF1579 domain-containing protein [Melioribacteraceae bacterium]
MKKITALFLSLMFVSILFAQEEVSQQMQDEATKAWMEFMTPGDPHTWFSKAVGDWEITNKYWFAPGAEPTISEGTAHAEMLMGGRYLKFDHKGSVMGMPFEGMSLEGYDNARGKYISIWVDNLGTGITYAEGDYDKEKNILVYEGKMTDPMTKEPVWFKQTVHPVNENQYMFEMYMKGPDGKEMKNMEITFNRKK